MPTKLYVENLSSDASKDDIQELFQQAGTVTSVEILNDPDPESPDTYLGIVKMILQEEAEAAIELLHGQEFFGRLLRIALGPHGVGDKP
jgi:RNA recognition motif-containing protein